MATMATMATTAMTMTSGGRLDILTSGGRLDILRLLERSREGVTLKNNSSIEFLAWLAVI